MQTITPRGMTLEKPHADRKRELYSSSLGTKLSDAKREKRDIKDAIREVKGLRSWEDQGY